MSSVPRIQDTKDLSAQSLQSAKQCKSRADAFIKTRDICIYRNSTAFVQKSVPQGTKESLQHAKILYIMDSAAAAEDPGLGKHMALADPDLLCLYSAVPSAYVWLPLERE